jgi:hypothetical protein
VYERHTKALIEIITSCSGQGRWEAVHVILWINSASTSISTVMHKLQKCFSPGCMKYVWAREFALQEDELSGTHYHVAFFYNAQKHSFQTLRSGLHALVTQDLLYQYQHVVPKKSSIKNIDLAKSLNNNAASAYGLDLRNESGIRWAIFWFSYLAKTRSKESVPGRTFGTSQLKK